MGIKTVAVYSEIDRHSLHVEMADESGPAPSIKSYLNIEAIIKVIRETGTEAVHPGYGFLSENAHFCQALKENNVTFIGPSVDAMAAMGDKIQSKLIAKQAKVSVIPGHEGVVESEEQAIEIARKIGYPVMIKASAGGGGKGMRIAWDEKEIRENFRIAGSESKASFGDDRLLIEKFIEEPRHIEFQIIADNHGNVVYLPERECSIQRRNQKVVEEAPSVFIDPETRERMGKQAVQLAKAVGYSSAGTVEFLVDKHKNHYFLEMNTRLQVEHPITELITGLDLVELMIRVAANEKLPLSQKDVKIDGWAVESRVYAEDPRLYLPCVGTLRKYIEPRGENVRCDSGIREGSHISIYYDPLICKLSTHGSTRNQAMDLMEQSLDNYVIRGVTHNIPLLRSIVSNENLRSGKFSTKFLAETFPNGFTGYALDKSEAQILCTIAANIYWEQRIKAASINGAQGSDIVMIEPVHVKVGDYEFVIESPSNLQIEAKTFPVFSTIIKEKVYTLQFYPSESMSRFSLVFKGTEFEFQVFTETQKNLKKYEIMRETFDHSKSIHSPMPGQIIATFVEAGQQVQVGADLLVVEAMKMQNVIKSPVSGKIKNIFVAKGQNVNADEVLIEFL